MTASDTNSRDIASRNLNSTQQKWRPQQPPAARSRRRSGPRERVWALVKQKSQITDVSVSVKDKANHAVVLDKAISDKLNKDVQSYRLITVAVLVDRLKVNGSLARRALNDLEERGVIQKVVSHSSGSIYTRAAAGSD